jgi:hypothetical protein
MTDDSLWVDGPDGFEDVKPATESKRRIKSKPKQAGRFIGCPLGWLKLVFPVVHGRDELVVALALWRLRSIRGRRTVPVSNMALLAELGVDRGAKYRALKRLVAAGIITVKREGKRALVVTFARGRRPARV